MNFLEVKQLFETIEDEIKDLELRFEKRYAELESVEKHIADVQATKRVAEKQAEQDIANAKALAEDAQVKAKVEAKKCADLNAEVSVLISRKTELQSANLNLEKRNAAYIEYEAKSRKLLEAKEKNLLEREDALIQKESLKPRARSILPVE